MFIISCFALEESHYLKEEAQSTLGNHKRQMAYHSHMRIDENRKCSRPCGYEQSAFSFS